MEGTGEHSNHQGEKEGLLRPQDEAPATGLARLAGALGRPGWFVVLHTLGYAALVWVHNAGIPWFEQSPEAVRAVFAREHSLGRTLAQAAVLAYLFVLYGLTWRYWRIIRPRVSWLVRTGALIAVVAAAGVALNSVDIFAYVAFGRLAAVHGLNPYTHLYQEVHDSYAPFAWFHAPMPYGPLVLPFFMPAGVAAGVNAWLGVYVLKATWVLVHGGAGYLLYQILRHRGDDPARGLFLFLFNPLLVLELLVNGHNDGLMILCILGAIRALQTERTGWALVLALASTLIKLPGLLFLAAVGVLALRGRRWRAIAAAGMVGIAVVVTLQQTLIPGLDVAINLTNPHGQLNQHSIHRVIFQWLLRFGWFDPGMLHPTGWLRTGLTALFAGFCLWRAARVRTLEDVVQETVYMTLALLAGYSMRFWPWYLTWLLPFASLTASRTIRETLLLYSATSVLLYAVPHPLLAKRLGWQTLHHLFVHGIPLARLAAGILGNRGGPRNRPDDGHARSQQT